jgi:hypothetical protein
MRTSNYGVDACTTGLFANMVQGIDQAGMSAAENDDQAASGFDHQRLIVVKRIRLISIALRHDQMRIAGFEGVAARDFAADPDPRRQQMKIFIENKLRPGIPAIICTGRNADGVQLEIALPVAGTKNVGMGMNRERAGGSQCGQESAGMIVVTMAEDDPGTGVESATHLSRIADQAESLPAIEKQAGLGRLDQTSETVFAKQMAGAADTVFTKNGDAQFHGAGLFEKCFSLP